MIFQNFGFNRLKVSAAAPAGAVFPNQATQNWTSTQTDQWISGASSLFTTSNGVSYGAAAEIKTGIGSSVFGAGLARNGKIYLNNQSSKTLAIYNTSTDALTTLTLTGGSDMLGFSAVYNDYNKCIYINSFTGFYVVDTLTDTQVTHVTLANADVNLIYGSGYNARYMWGNNWYAGHTMFKIDCDNNTVSNTAVTSFTGDTAAGTMATNGKLYIGGGGGSTAGLHVWDPVNETMAYVGDMGDISDKYLNVVQGYDGYLYSLPGYNGTVIWKINPSNNTATQILTGVTTTNGKGMVVGADNKIYSVGNSGTMTIYNPTANTVSYETITSRNYQWMLMGSNGDLYYGTGGSLYRKTASGVTGSIAAGLAEMNGVISRLRSF